MKVHKMSKLRKAAFMHIQKTAGTSIVTMAKEFYGAHDVVGHGSFLTQTLPELERFSFVSGHFGMDMMCSLMPDRYKFTFLREPRDRILSQYYFMRSRPRGSWPIYGLAHDLELDAFLDLCVSGDHRVAQHFFNQQCFQLASGWGCSGMIEKNLDADTMLKLALDNLYKFDFIGFFETLNVDARHIFNNLGVDAASIVHSNKGVARKEISDLGSKTISKLNNLTILDYKIFCEAKRIFK